LDDEEEGERRRIEKRQNICMYKGKERERRELK
jgi:hypothetical protein